jgi:hypothetical protein
MAIEYTWSFGSIKVEDKLSLSDVVVFFEPRLLAVDGEHSARWYAGVTLDDPDPASFVAFPTDPADTPAFEAHLKAWALAAEGRTEDEIKASLADQIADLKTAPVEKVLP